MIERDILRRAGHTAQITCPFIALNERDPVDLLNYRSIQLASLTASNIFGVLMRIGLSPRASSLTQSLSIGLAPFQSFFSTCKIPSTYNFRCQSGFAREIGSMIPFRIGSDTIAPLLSQSCAVGSAPSLIADTLPIAETGSVLPGIFAVLFWIGFISGSPDRLITFLTFAVQTGVSPLVFDCVPRGIKLTNRLFSIATGTSLDHDTGLIFKGPEEASSRVIAVLFAAFFLVPGNYTCFTPSMKVTGGIRAKFADRFHHMTGVAFFCLILWWRRILLAPRHPRLIDFCLAFLTFRAKLSSACLKTKRLFRLLNTAFSASLHDNLHSFVADIIAQGEGGVESAS